MLTYVDLAKLPPPPPAEDYLIYPWLQPGRMLLMVGPTEVGKTTLTLELISACLHGKLLWGRYPVRAIEQVLYLHAEHSEHSVSNMLQKRGDIGENKILMVHEFPTVGSAFLTPGKYEPNLLLLRELNETIAHIKPQLIVIEPAAAFLGHSENDNSAVRLLMNIMNTIARRSGAAVLTHHHYGKSHYDPERVRPKGVPTGEARGGQAFEDASERLIYLSKDLKGGYLRIETPKPKGYPVAQVRVTLNPETLQYTLAHPESYEMNNDAVGFFSYRLHHPETTMRQTIENLRQAWRCSPNQVYNIARRAVELQLLDPDDYKPLPQWQAQVQSDHPRQTSEEGDS